MFGCRLRQCQAERQNLQAEATKSLEEIMAAANGAVDADSKEKHKAAMQEIKRNLARATTS